MATIQLFQLYVPTHSGLCFNRAFRFLDRNGITWEIHYRINARDGSTVTHELSPADLN